MMARSKQPSRQVSTSSALSPNLQLTIRRLGEIGPLSDVAAFAKVVERCLGERCDVVNPRDWIAAP
jgi:hypothetical protein